jgi:serine/threonine-protein kinase
MRALAKNPANRYQTADEFLAALDEAERDPRGGTAIAAAAVPPSDEDSSRRKKLIALGIVAALIAALVAYALTRSEQVRVPTVIGERQTEATEILEDAGFEVLPSTFESCDEPRTVAEQDPAAGSRADEGSTVEISVSLGLSVKVPDVLGEPLAEAADTLQEEQLQVEDKRVFSSRVEEGRVVRTDPAVGEQVPCDSLVTVFASKGPNLVTVPDVIGQQESAAESELRSAGFVPNVESENSDEPEGTVIGQDPGAGSMLEKGTEVIVTVSNGAGSVVVPNVEGQPRDTAVSTLQGRGVTNIKVVEQETDDPTEDDRVTSQAPPGGTRIRQGDRVTIFVAVFVEPVEPVEPPAGEGNPQP